MTTPQTSAADLSPDYTPKPATGEGPARCGATGRGAFDHAAPVLAGLRVEGAGVADAGGLPQSLGTAADRFDQPKDEPGTRLGALTRDTG
jgi:hypothetical protein